MVGALALCCAGDYVFGLYPLMKDVWNSVRVELPWSSRFIATYGVWLWIAMAVGGVMSLGFAFRRPGRASTLVLNVTMCVSASWLVYVARRGLFAPLANLILDLVDPARELPRHN